MIEWRDEAIVLSQVPLGDHKAVLTVLTQQHGRRSGVVQGAKSKLKRGILLPGNSIWVQWKARLADQLGSFTPELATAHAALVLDDPGRLAALSSACALTEIAVPEGQALPALFGSFRALQDALASEIWPSVYVHWELALLRALGYGLDFSSCAATGTNDALVYVSPKSGRAVSASAGEPYRDKLLPLPPFLLGTAEGGADDIRAGLALTAYFLVRHALGGQSLPAARQRLVDRL